jgi:ATP-binding cassette subfamily F protein 3
MLQLNNISYSIGDHDIINGLSWAIQPGEKIALIGDNGTGKTTLFRIITKEITEFKGKVIKPKRFRIGYLPQEELAVSQGDVLQYVIRGVEGILELQNKIAEIYNKINQADSSDQESSLLKQAGNMEQDFEALNGYAIEAEAKKILSGLGFLQEQFYTPMKKLSGGWRMRVYLARLLIQKPDLLLLDEPTNHLDIPALEWLEQYLLGFTGSIVIISHDRYFIDRLAGKIYELEDGKLKAYAGNYHFYEKKKEEEILSGERRLKNQLNERKRIERVIEKNRYRKDRAAQAQSLIKQLNRMEDLDPIKSKSRFYFKFSTRTRSYNHVLDIRNLSFSYNEKDGEVLKSVNLDLYREEKVAMVGVNGAGKTTLTKLIEGRLQSVHGKLKLGERVEIGLYTQHQIDALDLNSSIYEEVCKVTNSESFSKVRDILGIFQFKGDVIDKKIGVLSGGEKARVSLAKILISPFNFLIMDEPTNHLDRISREALEYALQEYNGTLLLISHDRYFLDKIVSRVFELKDGQVKTYPGNYSEYVHKREKTDQIKESSEIRENLKIGEISPVSRKEIKQKQAEIRQAVSRQRKEFNKRIGLLEGKIENRENEKKKIEEKLLKEDTYNDKVELVELQKRYSLVSRELEEYTIEWEEVNLSLEELLERLEADLIIE